MTSSVVLFPVVLFVSSLGDHDVVSSDFLEGLSRRLVRGFEVLHVSDLSSKCGSFVHAVFGHNVVYSHM